MKIHPAADILPMMEEDELQDLAASIAEIGQKMPIIMDGNVLIDGRNRLAACRLAGVEPIFAQLPAGKDPEGWIYSANVMRRSLTKGQLAMIMAMIYPDPEKGGRGKKSVAITSAVSAGFSSRRLNEARSVLHHNRALADSVRLGNTSLDEALARVKREQQLQKSEQDKWDRLRQSALDLVDQVKEERLTIEEAFAVLLGREQELRQIRKDARHSAQVIVTEFSGHVSAIVQGVENGEHVSLSDEELEQFRTAYKLLLERLHSSAPPEA